MDSDGKVAGKRKKRWNYRLMVLVLTAVVIYGVSVAGAADNVVSNLSVYPEPIKIGSSAYIQFNLAQEAKVSVNIYTESGEHVSSLWNSLNKAAGPQFISWNGRDKNGVYVTDGNYKVVVDAKDNAGTQIGYAEKTVKAARVPTISNVTDTPDPFNPALGEQSAIKFTLSSDAMVTVNIIKNFVTVRTLALNEPMAAGTHTVYWDGKDSSGNLVADGPVTYQINAANPTEPTFKSTFSSTATVEKEEPEITGLSITPDPFKITSSNMSIMYNLSEDAKVTLKIVDAEGSAVRTILNAAAKRAGFNSSSWDGKNDSGTYVPEGTYTVVVDAVDYADREAAQQTKSFKAGYHPAVSDFSATPDIFNPEDPATQNTTINYTISRDALVTVEILKGYNKVKTLVNQELQSAGSHTVVWDGRDEAGKVVGDADYTVQVYVVSPTVASFFNTYKGTVTVEKGAPGITGVTLSPEPYKLGSSGNLSIMYNLTEDSTVYINVYRGDVLVRKLVDGQTKKTGFNSVTWDGKDDDGNYVPEGIYTVTIKGTDRFGLSDQAEGNVTCGYHPAISNVSFVPELFNPLETVSSAAYFTLSHDAKVTLSIIKGNLPVRTISAVLPAGDRYITWDGRDGNGNLVADGPYTYQIDAVSQVVDTFKSTAKGTVIIEAAQPVLSDLSVMPAIVKIGSNASFKYVLSEPAVVSGQILRSQDRSLVRDLPPETKNAGGYYSLNWDTRDKEGNLITTGNYILVLNALDSFGKTTSAELGFQAGAVPVISNVLVQPAIVDLTAGRETLISYTVSEDSMVTVKVFDSAGTAVKSLQTYKNVKAGTDSVSWDCTDGKGQLLNGTFTVKIDAISAIGSFRAEQVSATVTVTGTPPPPPPSCTECHQTFPQSHPVENCAACHGNNEPIGTMHTGTEDCTSCHSGHSYNEFALYDCTFCHNETYSYKVPYHPADINALHTAPQSDCLNCHTTKTNIIRHTNPDTGQADDCTVCHQSTKPEVVTAIETGDKNCAACHASASHEQVHTPTGIQSDCVKCHIDNLVTEHLENPKTQAGNSWTCNTCHDSTVPEVVYAIDNGQKNCSACHTQASHQTVHETTNLDANCTTCHNNNLVDEHLNNPTTQTGNNWTCDTCHQSAKPEVTWAIASGNEQCMACHDTGHNVNFAEKVPPDIPLYSGLEWTQPIDAAIFAGESWMPAEFAEAGRVVISSRSNNITGDAVWSFYEAQMAANGWTLASAAPAPGSDFFNVTFTKGVRKAVIWFYGGAGHTASPVLPSGYRVEVIYK